MGRCMFRVGDFCVTQWEPDPRHPIEKAGVSPLIAKQLHLFAYSFIRYALVRLKEATSRVVKDVGEYA